MRFQQMTPERVEEICAKVEAVLTEAYDQERRVATHGERPCERDARALVAALLAAGVVFKGRA